MFQLELARPITALHDTLMTRDCESLLRKRESIMHFCATCRRFRP